VSAIGRNAGQRFAQPQATIRQSEKRLLITANLTWITLLLFAAAMVVMIVGYTRAGNQLTPDVIVVAGYPNPLFVVLDWHGRWRSDWR
jgi:hypothetical protein